MNSINKTGKINENKNVPTDLEIRQSKYDNVKKEVDVLVSNKASLDSNEENTGDGDGDVYDLDSFFNLMSFKSKPL